MTRTSLHRAVFAVAAASLLATAAFAQSVAFKDPTGDDNGPGTYTYPTDGVYKAGSFDLTAMKLDVKGDKANVEVSVNSNLEDPWGMKTGFSVQMVFIFIDTDGKDGSGHTEGIPGLNITFAPADAWEKCIILSPQGMSRVRSEVDQNAASVAKDVIVPNRTRGAAKTISAQFDAKELGGGDPSKWGYQVIMQSNEGFPGSGDVLTRKVNEYEGQHRFGGGNDGDCDPHVMDILAGKGEGKPEEADLQHKMLAYECNPDGTSKKMAVLNMVRK